MRLELSLPERVSPVDELLEPSPALLRQIVSEYASELGDAPPELADCFFLFVPSRLLRRCMLAEARDVPVDAYLWLMHASSYLRGVWLRQELRRTQLETMSILPGAPVATEAFTSAVTRARRGCRASAAGGAQALAYLDRVVRELVSMFAYARGAVLHGLEQTGPGPQPPRDLITPGGVLWCGYREPRLDVISHLHDVNVRLERGQEPRWRELAEWIVPLAQAETDRARHVWHEQPGLPLIRGFAALLESTAAALECFQAASLLAVRALAEEDGETARQAALVSAMSLLAYESYGLGLTNSAYDDEPGAALPVLSS